MMKRADNNHANPHNKNKETQTIATVTNSSKTVNLQKPKVKRISRKVQFAQPLAEQRVFDKTQSPNAETNTIFVNQSSKSTINDLEPPLSLVARLDIAAKKLNARQAKSVVEETDASSTKTTKSTKSSTSGYREVSKSPTSGLSKQGKKSDRQNH